MNEMSKYHRYSDHWSCYTNSVIDRKYILAYSFDYNAIVFIRALHNAWSWPKIQFAKGSGLSTSDINVANVVPSSFLMVASWLRFFSKMTAWRDWNCPKSFIVQLCRYRFPVLKSSWDSWFSGVLIKATLAWIIRIKSSNNIIST